MEPTLNKKLQVGIYQPLYMSKLMGKKRDRYRKMPLKTKIMFLKRVFEEGHSIKKVSAEYKINYSTAKTLIRNEKLKKGKIKLSQISLEESSYDREPTEATEETATVATYRLVEFRPRDEFQPMLSIPLRKIEIISRISFPSCTNF